MPAVIFFACLFIPLFPAGDIEQKSSFIDGHYIPQIPTMGILQSNREPKKLILFDGTYRLQRREDTSSKNDRSQACSWRLRLFDFSISHPEVKHLRPYAVVATQTGEGIFKATCAESLGKRICRDFDLRTDDILWIEHYPDEPALYVAMFKPKSYFGNEIFYAIDWRPIRPNELQLIQPFIQEIENFKCT